MFCFRVGGQKRANRSPKGRLQIIRKSNGDVILTRAKLPVSSILSHYIYIYLFFFSSKKSGLTFYMQTFQS